MIKSSRFRYTSSKKKGFLL